MLFRSLSVLGWRWRRSCGRRSRRHRRRGSWWMWVGQRWGRSCISRRGSQSRGRGCGCGSCCAGSRARGVVPPSRSECHGVVVSLPRVALERRRHPRELWFVFSCCFEPKKLHSFVRLLFIPPRRCLFVFSFSVFEFLFSFVFCFVPVPTVVY